jgi:hypothetical protein
VTHANNMHQRINKLAFKATSGGLDVTAPANANLCVPGYYMLFLLNEQGVPSIARMIRIDAPTEATGYSLSGTITASGNGLSGVTVTTGSISTTTDEDGNYTFSGLAAGDYTITPNKTGYTFTPVSRSVPITTANVAEVDFTASAVTVTYRISGTVTQSGSGLSGVTMRAGGSITTTGSGGSYILSSLQAGTYTVTPSKSGFTFSPTNRSVQLLAGDVAGVNFTADATATYRISGIVTSGGSGLPGVTVTAGNALATTADDGSYTLSGLKAGTYPVTPSKSGYTFSPASRSVTLSVTDASGVNFAGTTGAVSYSLSGKVTLSGGGLPGVKVTAGSKSATTSATGAYTLSGLAPGAYTVTPSREGYDFFPTSRSVSLAANTSDTNFTAQVVTTLISVTVGKREVKGKKPVTGKVRFNRKVPATTTVSLASSDPAARPPSSVKVKKGKSQATFTVSTRKVSARTPVIITGRAGSSTKTARFTVRP